MNDLATRLEKIVISKSEGVSGYGAGGGAAGRQADLAEVRQLDEDGAVEERQQHRACDLFRGADSNWISQITPQCPPLPVIKVFIEGIGEVVALVDSGASSSAIRRSLAKNLDKLCDSLHDLPRSKAKVKISSLVVPGTDHVTQQNEKSSQNLDVN
ncbi:hypothetical protein OUZ56_012297 [Daphnia magna]|uniref:Peptidase A2 domain-containing protein n=1 Tax=Daphnia magna TaxID=35525 RepID=A0ABQ9Z2Q6_9CRUS|nr:hypothetical protein OUZ56_012297 [Daphnia magna]